MSVAHRSDESLVVINRDRSGDAGRDLKRSDGDCKGIGEEEEDGNKNGKDREMHLGFLEWIWLLDEWIDCWRRWELRKQVDVECFVMIIVGDKNEEREEKRSRILRTRRCQPVINRLECIW